MDELEAQAPHLETLTVGHRQAADAGWAGSSTTAAAAPPAATACLSGVAAADLVDAAGQPLVSKVCAARSA
jgi:hypothetical protein